MATFSCNDIDGLVMDMDSFSRLPQAKIRDMLEAGAEVIRKAHVDAINASLKRTGKLMGSPKIKIVAGKSYALIYPDGTHHTYRAKTGSGVARNADVGFVHEFGGHGNPALGWMQNANEKSADATVDAEMEVFDSWLTSLKL